MVGEGREPLICLMAARDGDLSKAVLVESFASGDADRSIPGGAVRFAVGRFRGRMRIDY
jgi:hypothetical protein